MKKMTMLISIFLSTLLFNGCAGSSYNITTSGENNSNVAFVKFSDTCSYQIDDVIKYEEDSKISDGIEGRTTKIKILSNSICNNITHLNWKIISSNMWYIDSITDALLSSKQNCQVESSIKGIDFLKCDGGYRIASSEIKYEGYDNRNLIYTSKECYEELKNKVNNCQNNTNNKNNSLKTVKNESSVIGEKMSNLKKLYEDGLITKEEYINKKKQLLNNY
jgi:hypothetical protein